MIKHVFILLLAITGFITKADTIDNWQVYHNKVQVAAFNQNNQPGVITIKKADIKKGDIVTLRYHTDTPCIDCEVYLGVEEGKHHLVTSVTNKGTGAPLDIDLEKLLYFDRNTGKNYFECYYLEGEGRDKKMVFKIVLK